MSYIIDYEALFYTLLAFINQLHFLAPKRFYYCNQSISIGYFQYNDFYNFPIIVLLDNDLINLFFQFSFSVLMFVPLFYFSNSVLITLLY